MRERSKIMCVAVLILSVLAMSSTALALRGMSVQQPLSAERILVQRFVSSRTLKRTKFS